MTPTNEIRRAVSEKQSLTRRTFAAIGASAVTTALAGCSTVGDFLGGYLLDDVNVFNVTDGRITGEIEVTDPDGEVVLDEEFDLPPDKETEENGEEDDSATVYEEVLTATGEYTVGVELDDDSEIDGETTAQETVEVTSLEDDHVTVLFSTNGTDSPITVTVIQELSDLEAFDES